MNITPIHSQEESSVNADSLTVSFLTYTLRDTSNLNLEDSVILESLINSRPTRIFFEVEGSSFKLAHEYIRNYYTTRGYNLSFSENSDEYFLVVLTRDDFASLGLDGFNFESFLNHRAQGSSTYLIENRDEVSKDLTESSLRMTTNNSGYSKEEELSILDEFFN